MFTTDDNRTLFYVVSGASSRSFAVANGNNWIPT